MRTRNLFLKSVHRIVTLTLITGAMSVPSAIHAGVEHDQRVAASAVLSASTGFHREQLAIYPVIVKDRVNAAAAAALVHAQQVVAAAATKVDTHAVSVQIASLSNYKKLDDSTVTALTAKTAALAAQVKAAADEHDRQVAAAAAEAARVANTPDGARANARTIMAAQYGWGEEQFQCLNQLWTKESGWRVNAYNPGGGATGIPQALPGSKMASAGADWATNATTQIRWGLGYIAGSYGSPCAAWAHSVAMNWY